jgi:hypothetical protein
MPTDYEGDPTAVQAPGVAPDADAIVRVALPADGDPPNASTWAQPLNLLADKCKWLQTRIAKAGLTPRFLQRVKTAVGHTRWALDRLGLPAATILHWQEHWHKSAVSSGDTTGAMEDFIGHWLVCLNGGTSAVFTSSDAEMPSVTIGGGDALNNYAELWSGLIPDFSSGIDMVVESSVKFETADPADTVTIFGMVGRGAGASFSNQGLAFVKSTIGAIWYCSAIGPSGQTLVPTGITPSTSAFQRLRIEYRGASVNDGGAAAAYFYIDGAHVVTITTNLPVLSFVLKAVVFAVKNLTGSNAAGQRIFVRPVNFACNYLPAVTT